MELNSDRIFKSIDDICVNERLFKCAVAGDREIKILDMNNWREIEKEKIKLPPNAGKVSQLVIHHQANTHLPNHPSQKSQKIEKSQFFKTQKKLIL